MNEIVYDTIILCITFQITISEIFVIATLTVSLFSWMFETCT